MVDEAQRITREVLDAILSLTDAARREKTKFGVILAGTPTLPSHLRKMDVSYLNRARLLRMERLDVQSTKSALFQPMTNAGLDVRLEEVVENRLIDQTQCYPYFVQSIGHAIWNVADASTDRVVDAGTVALAKPRWEEDVNVMYGDRFQELDSQELVPFTAAIAAVYAGLQSSESQCLDAYDIRKIVNAVDADVRAQDIVDELLALGYIWPAKGKDILYEPGIPSLMDYILAIARDRGELI